MSIVRHHHRRNKGRVVAVRTHRRAGTHHAKRMHPAGCTCPMHKGLHKAKHVTSEGAAQKSPLVLKDGKLASKNEEFKFYDLKGKKSFKSKDYRMVKKGPRTFAVAKTPSGGEAWRIYSPPK